MEIKEGDYVWLDGAKCEVTYVNRFRNVLYAIHPKSGIWALYYDKVKRVIRVVAEMGNSNATSHIS